MSFCIFAGIPAFKESSITVMTAFTSASMLRSSRSSFLLEISPVLRDLITVIFEKEICRGCFSPLTIKLPHIKWTGKKETAILLFLLHPVPFYAMLMVRTPRQKGSDLHSHHKRKLAHKEADPGRLCEAVSGKGLQADHAVGN